MYNVIESYNCDNYVIVNKSYALPRFACPTLTWKTCGVWKQDPQFEIKISKRLSKYMLQLVK